MIRKHQNDDNSTTPEHDVKLDEEKSPLSVAKKPRGRPRKQQPQAPPTLTHLSHQAHSRPSSHPDENLTNLWRSQREVALLREEVEAQRPKVALLESALHHFQLAQLHNAQETLKRIQETENKLLERCVCVLFSERCRNADSDDPQANFETVCDDLESSGLHIRMEETEECGDRIETPYGPRYISLVDFSKFIEENVHRFQTGK
jgi:hypothetical protein